MKPKVSQRRVIRYVQEEQEAMDAALLAGIQQLRSAAPDAWSVKLTFCRKNGLSSVVEVTEVPRKKRFIQVPDLSGLEASLVYFVPALRTDGAEDLERWAHMQGLAFSSACAWSVQVADTLCGVFSVKFSSFFHRAWVKTDFASVANLAGFHA